MKRYLILGQNFKNPGSAYRGVDRRDIPDVPNEIEKAKLLNQSIEKYIEKRDLSVKEGEYLNNYRLASEIANSFTLNNDNGEVFEVVQIVYPDEPKPNHMVFLGYDVIGLNESGSIILDQLLRDSSLTDEYKKFNTQLNKNSLFDELSIAEEFLKLSARKIGGEISSRIIGLYR